MTVITSAYAQEVPAVAAPPPEGSILLSMLPLLLVFAVFYFLVIRPQQRRLRTHQQMISAIRRGDKVVTAGGILGTVQKVEDDQDILHVEIAEGIRVRVARGTISSVLSKPQPGSDTGNAGASTR